MNITPNSFFYRWMLWKSEPRTSCGIFWKVLMTSTIYLYILLTIPSQIYLQVAFGSNPWTNLFGGTLKGLDTDAFAWWQHFAVFQGAILTLVSVAVTALLAVFCLLAIIALSLDKLSESEKVDTLLTELKNSAVGRVKQKTCTIVTYNYESENDEA
jgi:type IV secretory pathway TraG/TraD family ATPase VirD4